MSIGFLRPLRLSLVRTPPTSKALVPIAPPAGSTALVPVPREPSLADLTAQIQSAHIDATKAIAAGAAATIQAGHALIAAKERVRKEHGHGYWEDYVVLDCRLSLRTAQHYMFLAREEPKLKQLLEEKAQPFASLTQAAALKFLSSAQQKKRRTTKK